MLCAALTPFSLAQTVRHPALQAVAGAGLPEGEAEGKRALFVPLSECYSIFCAPHQSLCAIKVLASCHLLHPHALAKCVSMIWRPHRALDSERSCPLDVQDRRLAHAWDSHSVCDVWLRARWFPTGLTRRMIEEHMGCKPRPFPGCCNRSRRRRSGCLSHTRTACRPRGPSSLERDWREAEGLPQDEEMEAVPEPTVRKGPTPEQITAIKVRCLVSHVLQEAPASHDFLAPATVLSCCKSL